MATKYLSSSSYPTISETHFIFSGILLHLGKFAAKDDFTHNEVAASISQKIGQYWAIMDKASIVSVILDPRNKLTAFADHLKQSACMHIQSIFDIYKGRSSLPMSSPKACTPRSTRRYFAQLQQGISQTGETASSSTINPSSVTGSSELD